MLQIIKSIEAYVVVTLLESCNISCTLCNFKGLILADDISAVKLFKLLSRLLYVLFMPVCLHFLLQLSAFEIYKVPQKVYTK